MKGSNPIKIHMHDKVYQKGFVNIKITAMTFGDGQKRRANPPSEFVRQHQRSLPFIPSHQGMGNELLDRLTEEIFNACIRKAFHRCSR